MKIAIGTDHAGFEAKEALRKALEEKGEEVLDCGTFSSEPVDYPGYARAVAEKVLSGEAERGVLVCGSGVGMSIAANKFPGIRAALCFSREVAELCRLHNDANVLVLPGRFFSAVELFGMVEIWLSTPFAGGRHKRRLDEIASIECQTMRQGDGEHRRR